ncbi:MAG: hypothetical protein ABI461_18415 [Polyangiaceae bacterium]
MRARLSVSFAAVSMLGVLACGGDPLPQAPAHPFTAATAKPAPTSAEAPPTAPYAQLTRDEINRRAVLFNIPLFWVADTNANKAIDPNEVRTLLFYPTDATWVENGKFTALFDAAYKKLAQGDFEPKDAPKEDAERRKLVIQELDQGRATLVDNDFSGSTNEEKAFVRHMLVAAKLIDGLYATQEGIGALAAKVPEGDLPSQSMFRRNWGPKCHAPLTEKNPQCSAIPGSPKPLVSIYPDAIQAQPSFCEVLQKNANAKKLITPFTVVRDDGKGALTTVGYNEAFKEPMTAISKELSGAAVLLDDSKEGPLKAYLNAASKSFTDNDWTPADEAWAKMNATNSKFYVRIGPDETYWEPCSLKAGFHLTFAKINQDSLAWQKKLSPVEQDMEADLAKQIGSAYKARKVTFHLPDFIDIVVNSGDDRNAIGATIGQSLPNWGPVANQGRGRTVAMSNLYTDPDSMKIFRTQSEALLTKESMASFTSDTAPGLLGTILHEATHNLGPAHEYKVKGKTGEQVFGGSLASMLEELKAQTGALYFVDFAKKRNLINAELASQTYLHDIIWSFGHISRGMYDENKKPKPYSQLSAIQLGFLIEEGAVQFDENALAANGVDKGALVVHMDKVPAAVEKLMKKVATIKATGDKAGAEALIARYVDSDTYVPRKAITERMLRFPKASFVYSVEL